MHELTRNILIAATAIAVPALALADGASWNCRNVDLEIGCGGGKCTVAEAHTPMDVHLGVGGISVCAYTGCWEGAPAAVVRSGGFVTFIGAALPFSTNPDSVADIAVTVDTASGVATILVAGLYATPAICTNE